MNELNKEENNPFPSADWASPPGDTILDLLSERDWTRLQLSKLLGCTLEYLNQLIAGEASINKGTALKLEQVLGSTAGFWLNREAQYHAQLIKIKNNQLERKEMYKLTREEIERIGDIYFILTYAEYGDSLILSHEDATKIVWDMVEALRLDCTRDKLNEIIHYWRQVIDLGIEDDCRAGIVCTYVFNNGLVPEEHELEPYFGG